MNPHPVSSATSGPAGGPPSNAQPRRSMMAAILTDGHFWVPVVVLALGTLLLVVLSRLP